MIPHIRRVAIENYKSIAKSVVNLGPFAVFVGPNGAGKSNFVDALAFVQECLSESVEFAFKNRGGIGAVRRRSLGPATPIAISLGLALKDGTTADYSLEVATKGRHGFRIAAERCVIDYPGKPARFELEKGVFRKEIPGIKPRLAADRLALFAASALEEFRPVYDFLTSMRFYSIAPSSLRELQDADAGDYLKRDGSNAAAVLKRLGEGMGGTGRYDRLCRLLEKVVRGVERVEYRAVGRKETLRFSQNVGSRDPWTFEPLNMSDGTLRVLGLLLAVYQPGEHSVITIKEPEATVHPAAAEVVFQVLLDVANEKQVLLTTHSPDMLDQKGLKDEQIRVVTMERGQTIISPVSASSREAIMERLYTPGELLRNGELNPDLKKAEEMAGQIELFPGESS